MSGAKGIIKMTLTSAIEAAKDSYGNCIKRLEDFKREFGGDLTTMAIIPHAKNCLAALPEPKTEAEIVSIIIESDPEYYSRGVGQDVYDIIRALRDHDVLFVKELEMDERFLQDGFDKQLSHVIEECGEVLAAAGKTQRWGRTSVNPLLPKEQQETNESWLWRELHDLESAIARLKSVMAGAIP